MIRDPIFGGIDWDAVRQLAFSLGVVLLFISLGASTSGHWYDPYVRAWAYVQAHMPYFIGLSMILLLAGFYWAQFESGRL